MENSTRHGSHDAPAETLPGPAERLHFQGGLALGQGVSATWEDKAARRY